jgi:fluoride ion exporter CrcB/FEX
MLLNVAQQTAAAPNRYAFFLVNSVATFLISFLPAVFRPGRLGSFGPVIVSSVDCEKKGLKCV